MNVMKVKSYFEQLGMQVDEVQADEPSVGISEGWVVFRISSLHKWMEICYVDAVWSMKNNLGIFEILKDSTVNNELN